MRRLTDPQLWMMMVASMMILGGISIYVNHSAITNYSEDLLENQKRGEGIIKEVFEKLDQNNLNSNLTREQSKATYDLVNQYLLNATVLVRDSVK